MSELVVAGSVIAGIVGSLMVGYFMGKALSSNTGEKLTPREQEFERLLTERNEMLKKLNDVKGLSSFDRENYFRLYSNRLAVLNEMIDNFTSREITGKCNLCLREDQTILTTEDDNGTHSVCVKCIHDTLLEISAKKHWEENVSPNK